MIQRAAAIALTMAFLVSGGLDARQEKGDGKQITKKILKRTAVVLQQARKAVKENKNYTGDLAKAVRHQKFAKKLFKAGEYRKSAHHSLRARQLGFAALKANKVKPSEEVFTDEAAMGPAPGSGELDAVAEKEMPGEPGADDAIIASAANDDLD